MSRMTLTPPVGLDTRRTAREALDAPHVQAQNQAAAIVAVADELKKLREHMETRFTALTEHVNGAVGTMDGAATGLHQDVANLILRVQTLTTWLQHKFPEFEAEAQATLTQMIADINAQAAQLAAEQETPDANESADAVSVQVE